MRKSLREREERKEIEEEEEEEREEEKEEEERRRGREKQLGRVEETVKIRLKRARGLHENVGKNMLSKM